MDENFIDWICFVYTIFFGCSISNGLFRLEVFDRLIKKHQLNLFCYKIFYLLFGLRKLNLCALQTIYGEM